MQTQSSSGIATYHRDLALAVTVCMLSVVTMILFGYVQTFLSTNVGFGVTDLLRWP